jgi:hypothetical protein
LKIPSYLSKFKYIHISPSFFKTSRIVLRPKIPSSVFISQFDLESTQLFNSLEIYKFKHEHWPIEDFTTKRVCFTTDLRKLLENGPGALSLISNHFYIYGTNKLSGEFEPNSNGVPAGYGDSFNHRDILNIYSERYGDEEINIPHFHKFIKNLLKGCVPDAERIGEVWALEPSEVEFTGWAVSREVCTNKCVFYKIDDITRLPNKYVRVRNFKKKKAEEMALA